MSVITKKQGQLEYLAAEGISVPHCFTTRLGGVSDGSVKKQPVRKDTKIGPNDPCPCGSGKKYKKCCMQKDKMSE